MLVAFAAANIRLKKMGGYCSRFRKRRENDQIIVAEVVGQLNADGEVPHRAVGIDDERQPRASAVQHSARSLSAGSRAQLHGGISRELALSIRVLLLQ